MVSNCRGEQLAGELLEPWNQLSNASKRMALLDSN